MKPYLRHGLLAAALCVILSLIVSYGDLENTSTATILNLLTYAAITVAVYLAVRERRAMQGDYLSFGQGVGTGVQTVLVIGLVTSVVHYINAKFLNREMTQKLYNKFEEQLENQDLSEQEMEAAAQYGKMMVTPGGQAIISFIGFLFIGLIISLIVAAILRKEDVSGRHNNPMYGGNNGVNN